MSKIQFETMRNGYNRYQVDDCIGRMSDELDELKKKLELYTERCETLESQCQDIKEKYTTLSGELRMKEQAAEDIARIALREANVIVATAQDNADVIVQEALASAKQILLEVSKLGEETGEVKSRMMEQLEELTNALESFEVPPLPDLSLLKD